MQKELINMIASQIYSLFVVNTCAAGIQQKDGTYIRKYIPVTVNLIEQMILSNESMGCYQQGYKTGYVKWICYDFDCVDKENPNVEELDRKTVKKLTDFLDSMEIQYLKEFSGRRGIHVWVVFDRIMKKELAYNILISILEHVFKEEINEERKWGLDLFPATNSSRNNIVGKQVKFPLSCHKTGSRSFFYNDIFKYQEDTTSDAFFEEQYKILSTYKENDVSCVMTKLKIPETITKDYEVKYKKYHILDQCYVTSDEIRNILEKTQVFQNIFCRMKRGQSYFIDWAVLLGTLSPIDATGDITRTLFEEFPNYNAKKTTENLKKHKNHYYPATFGYLYHIYRLEMENTIDPKETGLVFLLKNLGINNSFVEEYYELSEKKNIGDISNTFLKEIGYLLSNDESPDVYIWNRLHLIKKKDKQLLQAEVDYAIKTGICNRKANEFRIYNRIESDSKVRRMVSLSASDRIVTTQLALNLCHYFRGEWKSFSYRPALTSKNEIFFSWYGSWGRYLDQIRTYLETPFFKDYEVVFMDLKGFYDHVDFLTVYRIIGENLEKEACNILQYLIKYNDDLMYKISNGRRIGVPQGPAYARIIAEIFLTKVIEILIERKYMNTRVYRYVDDIMIFCEPGVNSETLFSDVRNRLLRYGLPLNLEKSKCFGKIGNLQQEDKDKLMHVDDFNYDLREDDYTGVLTNRERRQNLRQYLSHNTFNMRSLGYVFGPKTIQVAKDWYFNHYRSEIISSVEGRGSGFRQFYFFLLRNDYYIQTVLDEKLLDAIPACSLNFTNFIDCLYLCLQKKEIETSTFYRIQKEYLSNLPMDEIDQRDRIVVDALVMMK